MTQVVSENAKALSTALLNAVSDIAAPSLASQQVLMGLLLDSPARYELALHLDKQGCIAPVGDWLMTRLQTLDAP